ncbi:MAG TPA: hypothetical protein VMB71_06555 [Acetobacteraceae bacterium]|jgi:hypothetical protein|nr:hypothetical protein [Acetobacteraceae bacterium]
MKNRSGGVEVKEDRLLEFDPTPAGLIAHPLSKAYKSVWASLRKALLKEHGAVCQVCKHVAEAQRHIHCHEVYAFPNDKAVRLERVVLLCWRCHDATHLERTRRQCGEKYVQEIAAHYRAVDGGLSQKAFEQDLQKTFRRMQAIRKFYGGPGATPPIDYGPYQGRINKFMARKPGETEGEDENDFEIFPDHEFPDDIAMWRDCFRQLAKALMTSSTSLVHLAID